MDSNRSRARAKARQHTEQARALRAVVKAQQRVDAAVAELDGALVTATNLHVHSAALAEALGVSVATLWRRVRAAREAVG